MQRIVLSLALLVFAKHAHAVEGMFLPMKGKIPAQEMKDLGFEVNEDNIVNMSKGAILNYGSGCTATFQSKDGLFGTNHHCGKGYCVVNLPVEQKNKFEIEGFIADTRDKEIKCADDFVRILKNVTNVSKQFLDIENESGSFDKKFATIDEKMKKMAKECENNQKNKYCKVAVMDNEKEPYYLYEFDVLDDIRLVWYPQDNLGAFGGDTDNWEYPRYTADFTYLRAYKDGKPYESKNFVPTSAEGVKPGDPLFIVGFPVNTDRNITSVEARYLRELSFLWVNQVFSELADLLQGNDSYNQSREYFLNYKKNTSLKMDLIDRFKVIESKQAVEAKIPEAKPMINEATKLIEKKYAYVPTLFLLRANNNFKLAKSLLIANDYVNAKKFAEEHKKTSTEKDRQDDLEKLKKKAIDSAKHFDAEMDIKLLSYYFQKLDELTVPSTAFADLKSEVQTYIQNELKSKPESVSTIVAQKKPDIYRQIAQYLLMKSTLIKDAPSITNLTQFDNDRMVKFSQALKSEFKKLDDEMTRLDNQLTWYNRNINVQLGILTPDANSTMRFTLGTVQGKYKPLYKPGTFGYATYLTGMKARRGFIKDSSNPDYPFFQLPKELLSVSRAVEMNSKFVDKKTGSIPVNFISDNVITGGNSGSGVFNKRGELVGYAFDGTPESVLGDISANPEARTILLDIRMVGFLGTDVYPKAKPIIKELGMIR